MSITIITVCAEEYDLSYNGREICNWFLMKQTYFRNGKCSYRLLTQYVFDSHEKAQAWAISLHREYVLGVPCNYTHEQLVSLQRMLYRKMHPAFRST